MKKIYVLDTNVLLMDPEAIFAFADNQIMIPLAVVEEIDDQKKKSSDIGYNARQTSRILDKLRKKGKLNQGVELDNGGCIKIIIDQDELVLPPGLSSSNMDNRIISTAYHLQRKNEESEVIMVSNDINLRLIADALGLKAQEHQIDRLAE
ncbi:MAG: PIN domain-containing protein, partial [Halanaerobiaceae bacterium]